MEEQNIVMKIFEWKKQYENIYATTISNQLFVFRTLSRTEFSKVHENAEYSDQDKEEAFCEIATLYPEDFDFTECVAGIPVVLTEKILSESLLLDDGKAREYMNGKRSEMRTYENQIPCLITEAFPTITLDEINSWDMHKTLLYLSRAEYVLSKLRGLPFVSQDGEVYEDIPEQEHMQTQNYQHQEPQEESYYVDDPGSKDIDEFNTGANMSMPNMKQLQELQKLCPEIDWAKEDSLLNGKFDFEKEAQLTFDAEEFGY